MSVALWILLVLTGWCLLSLPVGLLMGGHFKRMGQPHLHVVRARVDEAA